jgi:hypothetical protein
MSGLYPDVPGARIACDIDGTQGASFDGSIIAAMTNAQIIKLQDDTVSDSSGQPSFNATQYCALIFPQLMDIHGYYAQYYHVDYHNQDWPAQVQTSVDTTNGLDGAWVTRTLGSGMVGTSVIEKMRNNIVSEDWLGVKAVRFWGISGAGGKALTCVHLYGSPAATTDRLEFWHPTLDQPLSATPAFLDWAEVQRGTSTLLVKDVRLKNLASVLTANTIVIDYESATDSGGNFATAHSLSTDGITYGPTVTLTSLAPGAISGVINVKYAPLVTDELSLHSGRLFTTTGSWT